MGTPVIGEAPYRLNALRPVIGLMYRRHVDAEAGRITAGFDPVADRGAFLALFDPPPVPTLVLCGNATPPRSKAEMAALAERPGIDLRWVAGSLGLHEESAQTIAEPIVRFAGASPAEPAGRQQPAAP